MNEVAYRKHYQETGFWNEEGGDLAITDKEGRMVGTIGFFKGVKYLPGYEMGYGIQRREDRGKGYTTEALQLFTAYLLDTRQNTHRIEFHADVDNIGSRRAAEKAGYTYEGIKRGGVFVRGEFRDLAMYSILRGECPKLKDLMQL
jgi:ribosomal-protein-alanine N-acetyltransferase